MKVNSLGAQYCQKELVAKQTASSNKLNLRQVQCKSNFKDRSHNSSQSHHHVLRKLFKVIDKYHVVHTLTKGSIKKSEQIKNLASHMDS